MPQKRKPADHEMDLASDIFQDEVFNDELLNSYIRGHVSQQEFANRIEYLKQSALDRAYVKQEEEAAKDREFDEKCALGVA